MELWWNLDILWWNLDRFEHKFDGNITNWPCWSEGKLGTGPFTWLGQGFHTNFLEIPFQKGEKRHFDGLSIARKIGFMLTPVFCNASRNTMPCKLNPPHRITTSTSGIYNKGNSASVGQLLICDLSIVGGCPAMQTQPAPSNNNLCEWDLQQGQLLRAGFM